MKSSGARCNNSKWDWRAMFPGVELKNSGIAADWEIDPMKPSIPGLRQVLREEWVGLPFPFQGVVFQALCGWGVRKKLQVKQPKAYAWESV